MSRYVNLLEIADVNSGEIPRHLIPRSVDGEDPSHVRTAGHSECHILGEINPDVDGNLNKGPLTFATLPVPRAASTRAELPAGGLGASLGFAAAKGADTTA